MRSRRKRNGLIGVAIAAVLLVAAVSLPAFGVTRHAHRSSVANDAARALSLAQAADERSKKAAKLVPGKGPAGPAGPKGPGGSQGASGFNGSNGANGVNGPNGGNGSNGANGAPGDAGEDGDTGDAIRAVAVGDGDQATTFENDGSQPGSPYAVDDGDFDQGADEWLIVTATVDGTTSEDCVVAGEGLRVFVLIDGERVINGFLPWNFFHPGEFPPGDAVEFTDAPMQTGVLPPTGSDEERTVTVEINDSCGGGANTNWTVSGVRVTVAGTGPPAGAT